MASKNVQHPRRKNLCAVKVGDGTYTYSEGEADVDVMLGGFTLTHTCIVMETTAFDVCIGMNFIRQIPECVVGMLFSPSQLIVKDPKTQQVNLVPLESGNSSSAPTLNILSKVQRQKLNYGKRESYRLLTHYKESVLAEMGDLKCKVDLYVNPKNHTETLYCTPLNSCYGYNWGRMGLCWANPPWSHILKMLTKCILDRARLVVVTPDWGTTGEAATWRPLLNRLTRIRVPLPDAPLYVPDDSSTPLPAPRWGSIASYIDASDGVVPISELDPQLCKWLHRVNRGQSLSDLEKRLGN